MDGIRELIIRVDALVRVIEKSTLPEPFRSSRPCKSLLRPRRRGIAFLFAVIHHLQLLVERLPDNVGEVDDIGAKTMRLADAAKQAGVFLLPKGALENHLPSYAERSSTCLTGQR